MLVFVVARTRLDRYEEVRQHFEDWLLDRREGERRTRDRLSLEGDRRRSERRHRLNVEHEMSKLGWSVVDTDELTS